MTTKMLKILKTFIPIANNMPKILETKRSILFENNKYSVVCFQWKKGFHLPEHDHYGQCLFQVLNGKLCEKRGNLETILYKDDIGKIGKGFKHSITSLNESVSLHIYSPPPPKK